jgi:hypothetical protein
VIASGWITKTLVVGVWQRFTILPSVEKCRFSMHPRVEQLRRDETIAEADTLLLPLPNQLGVA